MDKKNREIYNNLLVSAEEAISHIKDGDKVILDMGCCEARGIERALAENYEKFNDVEFYQMIVCGPTVLADEKFAGHFKYNSLFASASNRKLIAAGLADYTPCFFYEMPEVIRDIIKPRAAIYSVSLPDENGYVSLGANVDYIASTIDYCEVKIAQVNKYVPRAMGGAIKHISEFTHLVEIDEELPEVPSIPLTDVEKAIGKNCASLIKDGDCIQLGIGGIPNAIAAELTRKKDLGLHSEMVGDGVIDLIESGVINNSKKSIKPGKTVISFCFGTRRLFDYIDSNPDILLEPIDFVNHPTVVAQIDNFVSVNSCVQVDLMGQVVSDSVGYNQLSGVGGQVDFVRGAAMSKGGKSVIAMPSSAKGGTISKIVPIIDEGAAVTTSRNDVDYIVTEYGIARLKGLSLRERAKALINIAHPNFRDELALAYEKRFNQKLS